MDTKFWVVVNKNTGLFFRKYKYLTYYQQMRGATKKDQWTDKLGRARVFESEAVARNSVPSEWLKADMLEFVEMVGCRVLKEDTWLKPIDDIINEYSNL